jgi:hypothetical protein
MTAKLRHVLTCFLYLFVMFFRQLIANFRLYYADCVNPPGCFSGSGLLWPSQGVARFASALARSSHTLQILKYTWALAQKT